MGPADQRNMLKIFPKLGYGRMAQNKPIFFESIICLKAYDFVACLLIIEIWRDVTDGEERTVKITVIYQKSSSLQLPTSNTCCHSKKCNSNKAKIV